MMRRIALITTLLVLALPAAATAQGGAFGPLPPAEPTPAATVESSSSGNGVTSRQTLFIIGGVLIAGFAVMGWFIARDARSSVPKAQLAGPRLREEGPHKHQKQAKAKARAKTRAQRQARKAHRKR